MSTIRCPHCGSPVMVRGNRWECGWCGDFGNISSLNPSERIKLSRASDAALEDLERGVLSILEGIQAHFGSGEKERLLACKLAIYGMSHALIPANNQTQHNFQLLQAFFQRYSFCTAGEVLGTARSGKPAFEDQFLLTKERFGSFWESLLPDLPQYEAYKAWPNWLYQTVDGLSQVECAFSGEDNSTLFDTLQEALDTHWSTYPLLHPDLSTLEAAVRNWDFSENEWACRDLLIAAFPDAVRFWSAEELLEMDTMELLGKVSEWKPEVGIQMMKLLLDTAECHLQEPEVAEQLLGNDLYELCQNQTVQPKLLAQLKEDARLVRQLFQSAYVGDLQEELLEACDWFGESMLKEHLQSLLAQNPHFKEFE